MTPEGIRAVDIKKDASGKYRYVHIVFGPHYFVQLKCMPNGKGTFILGATHHGFKADASQVAGE